MARRRLTRQEQQARTRSRLMRAATKVFSRKGMRDGSIEEVAQEAGYTKGAFYANFRSKEELFLAMLDERFEERLAEIEEAFADDDESPGDQARHAAGGFARATRADGESDRLFLEFASYALRNRGFRDELLEHFDTLRARLADVYGRRIESYGIDPPVPLDQLVRMVIAMADGWSLWALLEPDACDDELFESMMEIFVAGLGARAGLLEADFVSARSAGAPR